MSAFEGSWHADSDEKIARNSPIDPTLIGSLGIAFALAAFMVIRRAAGAFTQPLPFWPLAATAVATVVWVWFARVAYLRSPDAEAVFTRRIDQWLVTWLPLLTLTSVAVACSYPGRRAIDWVVWLPVIVASAAAPQVAVRQRPRTISKREASESASEPIEVLGTLLQQLTRSRDADGCESIQGRLVAEFAPGERTISLHVAFCPPFEQVPEVEAEAADGPDASVQVAQVLHNGARLEVRLQRPAAVAVNVSLEFVAQEPTS